MKPIAPGADTLGAAIITYRGWPLVKGAIDGLHAQTRRPDLIVVINNGSDDDSAKRIAEEYPHVTVIDEFPNRGYGAGLNAGLRVLLDRGVDRCMLVAQDCIMQPDVIARLENALQEDSDLAVVGPLVGYREVPDRILSAGGVLRGRRLHTTHRLSGRAMRDAPTEGWLPSDWLDGSIMLFSADAVRNTTFDERYFLYFEEVDFHRTLTLAGRRIACVPGARAWQTPGRGNAFLETRNRLLFIEKHRSVGGVLEELVRQFTLVGRDLRAGSAGRAYARERCAGSWAYIRRRFGPDAR
jgi:GT2 family glycosyltransferase